MNRIVMVGRIGGGDKKCGLPTEWYGITSDGWGGFRVKEKLRLLSTDFEKCLLAKRGLSMGPEGVYTMRIWEGRLYIDLTVLIVVVVQRI